MDKTRDKILLLLDQIEKELEKTGPGTLEKSTLLAAKAKAYASLVSVEANLRVVTALEPISEFQSQVGHFGPVLSERQKQDLREVATSFADEEFGKSLESSTALKEMLGDSMHSELYESDEELRNCAMGYIQNLKIVVVENEEGK